MTITAAIVLFAVIWFMVFFIVLPLNLTTQDDAGEIVPGTPPAAPAGFVVKRKAIITTVIAVVLWCAVAAVIVTGAITVRDFDWMHRLGPEPAAD